MVLGRDFMRLCKFKIICDVDNDRAMEFNNEVKSKADYDRIIMTIDCPDNSETLDIAEQNVECNDIYTDDLQN